MKRKLQLNAIEKWTGDGQTKVRGKGEEEEEEREESNQLRTK